MVKQENSKSIFNNLVKNLNNIYQTISCTECKRKISLDHNCNECNAKFCAECHFQIEKTKLCKSCKKTNTLQKKFNRNEFITELVDLIKLFEQDTSVKIIENNFLNVVSKENIGKLFEKDKSNVFASQQVFATSTPNVNHLKKVNFNSDITMIPANKKEELKDNTLKNTSKKKEEKSLSKRKIDSIEENEKDNSKTKKAKLVKETSKVAAQEVEEIEAEPEPEPAAQEEIINDDKVHETSNVNVQKEVQIVKIESIKLSEEDCDKIKNKIKEDDFFKELNNKLDENTKLLQDLKKEKISINYEEIQKIFLTELTKIVSEIKNPLASCFEIENIGKVNFTIHPFEKIEEPKKEFKNIEVQTDEIVVEKLSISIQTEEINVVDKIITKIEEKELIESIEKFDTSKNEVDKSNIEINFEKSNIDDDFEKSNTDDNFDKSNLNNSCVKSLNESNFEKSLIVNGLENDLIKKNYDKILSQDLLKNVESSKLSLDVENMFEDGDLDDDDFVDASSPRI